MSGLEIIINKPALCVYSHKLQDISDNLVWIFSNFFCGGGARWTVIKLADIKIYPVLMTVSLSTSYKLIRLH